MFLKFISRVFYYYGAEIWTKREDSRIQAMEIKFSKAILNKTNKDRSHGKESTEVRITQNKGKDRIRNTNINWN